MKSLFKGQKGITLIALLVTIIVLLILAGVTVATLTGKKGLLTNAQKVNEKNIYYSVEEQVKLALTNIRTEIYSKKSNDVNYNAQNELGIMAEIVRRDLNNSKWCIKPSVREAKGTTIKIEYNDSSIRKDMISEGIPSQNGKIEFSITLTPEDADLSRYVEQYGKKIIGYEKDGIWRLFYADSKNAYLIRQSIGNQSLNNISGFGVSTISELGKKLNSKYKAWNNKVNVSEYSINEKCTATLLEEQNWLEYKSQYANWAIGAPTLEMFIISYNASHTAQINCRIESNKSFGYQIGVNTKGENVTEYGVKAKELSSGSARDGAIYFGNAYWLASPSAYNSGRRG